MKSLLFRSSLLPAAFALTLNLIPATATAGDWPQWLGPNGTNQTTDEAFQPDVSKYQTAWETQIGHGYSAVAVANGRAIVMGHDGESTETVFCFDAQSGKEMWKVPYAAELLPRMHPGGPNATATFHGDRVLVLSKDGQLLSLDVTNGAKQWEARLTEVMKLEVPNWGFGCSPVVLGNRVIVSAGKVAAFDLATGRNAWVTSADTPAAYATPVPFEMNGQTYLAAMNGNGLSIHSAVDGSELAHRPMKAQFNLLAPTPLLLEGGKRIFISCNASSELLGFNGKELNVIWSTQELRNALNNSVIVNGVIYGIDGRQGTRSCKLVAMNLEDGAVLWTQDEFGYGTTIGIGATLLALTETGELVTAKLSPSGYQEIGRKQILEKTCWTTPVVADGNIYVRNDQGALVCLKAG